mgnify:CR=1 FL=1|tara:strand:- start:147 stop:614 length:468 start_codon:yes stop_codon:yes gene_type:complete
MKKLIKTIFLVSSSFAIFSSPINAGNSQTKIAGPFSVSSIVGTNIPKISKKKFKVVARDNLFWMRGDGRNFCRYTEIDAPLFVAPSKYTQAISAATLGYLKCVEEIVNFYSEDSSQFIDVIYELGFSKKGDKGIILGIYKHFNDRFTILKLNQDK